MDFDLKMLAYCGLYCEQCSSRVAVAERDPAHLELFLAKYRETRPELSDWECEGCKGRNICGPCAIKDCAAAKGFGSCADCDSFPCDAVSTFETDGWAHHREAVDNLRGIRERGAEAWFEDLKPSLRCHCGRRQSWYRQCPKHSPLP